MINSNQTLWNIPFKDKDIEILQGYNGPYSHYKISLSSDQSYSIDFVMEPGSDIFPAREGIVSRFYEGTDDYYTGIDIETGKQFWMENYIELLHDDGSLSLYMHLNKGFAENLGIEKGDHVNLNDKIAESGFSGWIGIVPHLHFSTYKRIKQLNQKPCQIVQSFPIKFNQYDGPLEHSELEQKYLSSSKILQGFNNTTHSYENIPLFKPNL